MSWKPVRSLSPRSVLPGLAVLLVLGAGAAAHANKPVPFGDRVDEPGVADASPVSAQSLATGNLELRVGPGLEAYDQATGEHLWSYRREGATALHLAMAGESAVVVWDDGMITSVRPSDHAVRWHRAVPGLADWLRADGEPGADTRTDTERRDTELERAAAALQPVTEPEPWVAVVTPALTMAFRDRDGDLRFNARPLADCSYDPLRTVHSDNAVLVPRSCTGGNSAGRPLPGLITGFRLDAPNWLLNAGPNVLLHRLDGHRAAVDDGPVIGTRTFDTVQGALEPVCGSPAVPFEAVKPEGTCSKP
ncbi:hypothetical protein [Saccharothrix sp. ST-888]|uniref:hypothetical protein n=1 Tax=Saccharothrix sp. ST-888 TaxID=1427391 RepID=UPI0005ECBED2|nr:hypothetical protein [Saccharothrix sp. ST-888]KJK57291.1 hypothetical protein UK12_17610 [Saccharothrix sp. ST-888]